MSDLHVVIVGGGFAGISAAKVLGNVEGVRVTLLDRRNHHLFQPLLYQVATAGLSPADISMPIRSVLRRYTNIEVRLAEVTGVDREQMLVHTDRGELPYDRLLLACGATHAYFGHDDWEEHAPGLKTLEQATEIRRRVLQAFEEAELTEDPERRRELLTFVVVGAGPTGVELAGALGEISRYTLSCDFRNIDPTQARVILLEGGSRILPSFAPEQSRSAQASLEKLGVSIWTESLVTDVSAEGVAIGSEFLRAKTVLWAAGVRASELNETLGQKLDSSGRVEVEPDLSLRGDRNVFVLGDQASVLKTDGSPVPGMAPGAMQMGRHAARCILRDLRGADRQQFRFVDKGQMATIGRAAAVAEIRGLSFSGLAAWLAWCLVHVFFLISFRNRLIVLLQWTWSYLRFKRGARLILGDDWRLQSEDAPEKVASENTISVPPKGTTRV